MTTVYERRYERRDTAANWASGNPILASGEWGYDTTNGIIKMGDGATAWSSLIPVPSTLLTQNAQTGTTYTLVLTDRDKLVELSNAAAITMTVPPNSSVAFPIGTQVHLLQTGAGQPTITAGVGVTINGTPGLKLRAQWSAATLIKRATNTWVATGDLSA